MKTSTSSYTRGSSLGNVGHMLIILSEKELVALIPIPIKEIIKTYGVLERRDSLLCYTFHLTLHSISPYMMKIIYQDIAQDTKILVSISFSLYC